MIEGLKVTIAGQKLHELLLDRSEHHQKRAGDYKRQIESIQIDSQDAQAFAVSSMRDPRQELKQHLDKHENIASELKFLATHLDQTEVYLLGDDDLQRLGVLKSRHGW